MPVVGNIDVWRGEDIILNLTHVPSKDITGWVISMTVSKAFNNTSKVFQVTGTITSGPNGQAQVIITSSQLNINPGTYAYDIFRNSPGFLRCLRVGNLIIHPDARFPQ